MHAIQTVTVQADDLNSDMEVFVFQPDGPGPHPAIILAQHIPIGHTGLENNDFTLKTARRYAENGFAVAAPFILHWWPKDETIEVKREAFRDDWTALDLQATFDLLGACHNPDLAACAMFYGGRVKQPMGPDTPPAIDLAGQIKCPVAGFFGGRDENPPPADVANMSTALTAAGATHDFTSYPDAGHGFQMFDNPERYNAAASDDAWDKVLAFMKQHLG